LAFDQSSPFTALGRFRVYYDAIATRPQAALSGPAPSSSGMMAEAVLASEFRSDSIFAKLAGYATGGGDNAALLTEGYAAHHPKPGVRLLAGLKREVWGNGVAWNPANLLDNELPFDPKTWRSRPLDGIAGRQMLLFGINNASGEYEMILLPQLKDPWGHTRAGGELATRITWLWDATEVNVGLIKTISNAPARMRRSAISLWGSRPINDGMTVFGDFAVHFSNPFSYPQTDFAHIATNGRTPVVASLIGANLRLPWEMSLRVEAAYNGFGYNRQERIRYLDGLTVSAQRGEIATVQAWAQRYQRYLLSRRYVGATLSREGISSTFDWRLGILFGMDDRSHSFSGALTYHVTPRLDLSIEAVYDGGPKPWSELANQPVARRLMGGLVWHL